MVERGASRRLPVPGLVEDRFESGLRAFDGASQAGEEPLHPRRDVQRTSLYMFQSFVIGGALPPYLGGHAIEALRGVVGACQGHIGDGPGDASVAIVEWVYGHE